VLTSATVNQVLVFFDDELRKTGFVTRDARSVESKWRAKIPPTLINSLDEG